MEEARSVPWLADRLSYGMTTLMSSAAFGALAGALAGMHFRGNAQPGDSLVAAQLRVSARATLRLFPVFAGFGA